ncbi:hypothetical protein ACIQPQ_15610 [Streptomyces sp. NPDC091281]|uniref:hypothetical protein n=1 Tax=Streptomyces sp. NPDC091281 TaxID=3365985 RepID=UPI00382C6A92
MRVFDTERQEWADSHRERLFDAERSLDLRRQRIVLQRTAIVLAVCGVAFGTWALGWKDEPKPYRPPAEEAPVASGTPDTPDDGAPPSDGTDPETDPSPSATPPAGFEVLIDTEGFRIAVPEDWTRDSTSSQYGIDIVEYRGPDDVSRVQVFQVMESSPYASVEEAQKAGSRLDGYRKIGLDYVANPDGGEAAEHEYTADELNGEPTTTSGYHAIDLRFTAADGNNYAVIAYGSESDGTDDERALLDTARAWFCPPATECAAPGSTS